MSMAAVITTGIMQGQGGRFGQVMLATLAMGAAIGLLNGICAVRVGLPPIVITLAVSYVVTRLQYVFTGGMPHGSLPDSFRVISEGWMGPIPVAGVIWIAVWFAFSFLLYKTPYGRKFYITGGNPRTSYLSGMSSTGIAVSAYVLSALLAGIAGLILSAFVGVPSTGLGDAYTLNSIASSVIGGTSFAGGIGALEGTFPGVLIMVFLQSTLTILNFPEAGKSISQGLVIAVMVAINVRAVKVKVIKK
jgi:ribose/xylose/arabinose/galactoside ABC-type transport system permease subunit